MSLTVPTEVRSLNPGRVKKEIQKRMLELVGWRDGRLAIRYGVEFGNIPAAILRVASEIDSDLIVLAFDARLEYSTGSCGQRRMGLFVQRPAPC